MRVASAHRREAQFFIGGAQDFELVAVLALVGVVAALRVGGGLDRGDKVTARGGSDEVAQDGLPERELALPNKRARREDRVHKGKRRGDRALPEGLGEPAHAARLVVRHGAGVLDAEASVDAARDLGVVPRRVGAPLLAVEQAAHRVAQRARSVVPQAVEPVPPRRVSAQHLGVRHPLLARREPTALDVVEALGLVEDVVPVAHDVVHPREGVLGGQLEDRRSNGRTVVQRLQAASAQPLLESVVQVRRPRGLRGQAAPLRVATGLQAAPALLHGGVDAIAQRVEPGDGPGEARRQRALLGLQRQDRRQRRRE